MSGVQSGTKLERLEALARQIQQEIALERRRLALDDGRIHPHTVTPPSSRTGNPAGDRCAQLGVTPLTVKKWAVQAGILPAVTRGRLALWVVQAYAERHR